MSKIIGKIRQTLTTQYNLSYRIKECSLDKPTMNRKLFIKVLNQLKELEDKSDFLVGELGIDLSVYEDTFYSIIYNLMKMSFNKQQLTFIDLYLNDLSLDPDWDGTITVQVDDKEKRVNFETPADVWNVINKLS